MDNYIRDLPEGFWEEESFIQDYVEGRLDASKKAEMEKRIQLDASLAHKVAIYKRLHISVAVARAEKQYQTWRKKRLIGGIVLVLTAIIAFFIIPPFLSQKPSKECKEMAVRIINSTVPDALKEDKGKGAERKPKAEDEQQNNDDQDFFKIEPTERKPQTEDEPKKAYKNALQSLAAIPKDSLQIQAVMKQFRSVVKQNNPYSPPAMYYIGVCYMLQNKCDTAYQQFINPKCEQPQGIDTDFSIAKLKVFFQ